MMAREQLRTKTPPENMKSRRNILWVLVIGLVSTWCAAGCALGADDSNKSRWISLFNGKDLTGWTPKITGYELGHNYGNTFRVENGVMKVSYDQYDKFGGKFGHLFYETPFSCYRLRLQYRFAQEHAERPGFPRLYRSPVAGRQRQGQAFDR